MPQIECDFYLCAYQEGGSCMRERVAVSATGQCLFAVLVDSACYTVTNRKAAWRKLFADAGLTEFYFPPR